MSATIARITTEIPSINGTYTYDEDLFAEVMKRTVAEMWELYKGEFGYDARTDLRRGEGGKYRRLRKSQLAAILAWKWTNVRDAQRAEEAAAEPTIQTATPAEIDERISRVEAQIAQVQQSLAKINEERARYDQGDSYYRHVMQKTIARHDRLRPQLTQKLAELRELAEPLHAEFERRGGWTRWYLVKHLHRDVSFSRCSRTPSTKNYWVTQYSGTPEAEMIAVAQSLVCTTCFPDAPVTDRPPTDPRLMTLEQAHTEALKEAKVREKAAKEASWVRLPDGELLFSVCMGSGGNVYNEGQLKTERAANNRMLQDAANLAIWFGPKHPDAPAWVETIRRCMLALAHSRGCALELLYDEMATKIGKKASREGVSLKAGWDYSLHKALSL